ncbi:hypothetical protein [Luteipulveratus flavus]|uniref:Uncharacterized protein n=1 Tax=Luteipulveratus flavus TaxID=3031728 RepID=A0ABT6C3Y5_9MICO|nr:hypothetical protein [Luteipulveratus sp. YIM 133296]MDF8263570.1 hypothetical protein [Luteipulveratus sp. YIM 133296]
MTAGLSSCTVPPAGLAGVGVDAHGGLVGYLAVCHDHIDGAQLYDEVESEHQADAMTAVDRSVKGSWTAPAPVRDFAAWSLTTPSAGWRADQPMVRLLPGRRYGFFGGTKDNSWSAEHIFFSTADLKRVKPRQVLYVDYFHGPEHSVVGSVADFRRAACQDEPIGATGTAH